MTAHSSLSRRGLLLSLPAVYAEAKEPWWERQLITILDLHTFAGQIEYFPPAEAARRKASLAFNTDTPYIHTLIQGMDDLGFYFRTSLAAKQNPDFLGAYLPEAHGRGLRVVPYFNVHYFTMEFARKHPDWVQITESGGTLDNLYDKGTTFCVNSPWRDWVIELVRDLCAYPIDGLFFDGPSFFPETCFCRWCQAKFRKLHGRPLPSKRDRKGRLARELLDFQSASLAEFLRDSNRVMKSLNPNAMLFGNSGALGGNWATARMNRVLVREQDILASEGGYVYNNLNNTPLWKAGLRARLLETQAGGKPVVTIACPALKPWTHSMLPPAEARLMYADSIANGSGIWVSLTLTEFDRPEMQAVIGMNHFITDNARYLHRTRSEARVAVVWSDTTANSYSPDAQLIDIGTVRGGTEAGNLDHEFWGVAETLLRAHVPFDVIDDETLERGDLARYQALYLPNVACLSDLAARRLDEFVRSGGQLFASFETSLYNEFGERRPGFALADAFGVSFTGAYKGPRRYDFMQTVEQHPLTRGLPSPVILSPVYYAQVRSTTARALVRYLDKRPGPYEIIPPLSKDPAVTVNRLGKGSVVYVSGDLGNTIFNFRMPDSLVLIENSVEFFQPNRPKLEGVPGSVEFTHRSKGKLHLFHFVNFTGEMTRPIRQVLPVRGARLLLPQGLNPKRAYTLVSKQEIAVGATLPLPEIHEYEVLVLETA